MQMYAYKSGDNFVQPVSVETISRLIGEMINRKLICINFEDQFIVNFLSKNAQYSQVAASHT